MADLEILRERMRDDILADEGAALARLVDLADLSPEDRTAISDHAADLVRAVRDAGDPGIMEAFLGEYGLSTGEGVALMCLAEALLRVPDAETIDDLIQDKIAPHDWAAHVGDSGSIMVNASTWALMLTGKVLEDDDKGVVGALRGAVRRLGEPAIRLAVARAMREMGAQFVLGRDINEAMKRGAAMVTRGYSYSYDMLGEAARTEADAMRYHGAYAQAIAAIARRTNSDDIRDNPGISVKLSALHPRYEYAQREEMLPVLSERFLSLARAARDAGIGLNVDAEEADRLDLSLDVIRAVLSDDALAGWDGFGVVVQAYGPRAGHAIDYLHELATQLDRRIMVRLVKGAYWDTEVKRAQVMGLDGFPVFTRKTNTDVSYIACARKLLSMRDRIYPQFATHNAHTVAAVLHMAGEDRTSFEFQRLHGMGETLHDVVHRQAGTRCRIYAPVGAHRDLLAYLVRRLLENGANSSFVNQIVDEEVSAEEIARDPFADALNGPAANPAIALPAAIYGVDRVNARGVDLTDPREIARIEAARAPFASPYQWNAGAGRTITNPADPEDIVGTVAEGDPASVERAVADAVEAAPGWAAVPVTERAAILRRAADLYEQHTPEFLALTAREAGKTLLDGVAEMREAVDFLRYYANEAIEAEKTGAPRGVIVCISPWNFPLAIFTGQVAAALSTGNAVIAKPAEQTPLTASRAVALLHEAGVPAGALRLMPGDGALVGAPLTADPRIDGVCFTGSTEVAKIIDRQLAQTAPEAMLIAETGGLNAMIVDSTALPEQAVRDILASSFQSAGQRCSALRVLYIQRDVEERVLEMLFGAMDALRIGDPWQLSTDVGPVIDQGARDGILAYIAAAAAEGRVLKQLDEPSGGLFVPPTVLRVKGIAAMEREVFGPVLHIARFDADDVETVVEEVNAATYGLTFGLHTRIDRRAQAVIDAAHVGNVYVNRNQIGAIVGSQPFGGEGLSGTGPKAGGPFYVSRFRRTPVDPAPGEASATLARADLEQALDGLSAGEWASRTDRVSKLREALRGKAAPAMRAAASLDMGPIDLPGPTGESNRLSLVPRGRVICAGPGVEAVLSQVVQALCCGNAVLAVAPGAGGAVAPLVAAGLPVRALDGTGDPADLAALPADAIACTGGSAALRRAMAAGDGAIRPLITELFDPASYSHERAVCIDTTAAGGNAALLAAAG